MVPDDANKDNSNENSQKDKIISSLIFSMNEQEYERYEKMKCSSIPSNKIKKILSGYLGNVSIKDDTSIMLASICKVFIAELVEEAKIVMTERGETGPIQPHHLKEAHRRLDSQDKTLQQRELEKVFD